MATETASHDEVMSTELVAVVVAMLGDSPHVLTAPESHATPRLPSGPLQTQHRTMQAGLRSWVEQQTGYHLKYVEQLYTFADPSRTKAGGRIISVSYLGSPAPQLGRATGCRGTSCSRGRIGAFPPSSWTKKLLRRSPRGSNPMRKPARRAASAARLILASKTSHGCPI